MAEGRPAEFHEKVLIRNPFPHHRTGGLPPAWQPLHCHPPLPVLPLCYRLKGVGHHAMAAGHRANFSSR